MKKTILLILLFLFLFYSKANAQTTITVGTGTTTVPNNTAPNPYGAYFTSSRIQYLILASELTAAGFKGSTVITSLAFNISAVGVPTVGTPCPSVGTLSGFTIKMKNTTSVALTTNFDNVGLTRVLDPVSYTQNTVGWNTHTFNTSFIWDGVSNLLVDLCHDNTPGGATCYSASPSYFYTATSFNSTMHYWTDAAGSQCGVATGTLGSPNTTFRANMRFGIVPPIVVTVPPIASFAYNDADTIWINTPRTIVNTSNETDRSYWDIMGYNSNNKQGPYLAYSASRQCKNTEGINDCFMDTVNQSNNFKYTFPAAGYYRLKVTALNKFGFDTYIDTIYVDTPSSKPHTEFFIDKRIIGVNDFASCFDLSSNGPTSWRWYLRSDNPNPNPLNPNRFTPLNTSQNPNLNAFDGGTFDLCLVTSNLRGADTLCKKDHIRIIPGYPICAGQSADKDTIARDNEGAAMLSTVGGMYLPALIGNCGKGFTISTCSDTVILYIDRFRMRSGASVSDSLLIHSGTLSGPVIARYGGLGSSIPNALRTVKVPGGIAYLETKLSVGITGNNGDSGYTVRWTSVPPSYSKPHAAFNIPDTIYDNYTVQYNNQTTGVNIKYSWDTNGDGIYGLDHPSNGIYDSTSTNPSRTFSVLSPYRANICLKAYNCVGADTACKQVQFLPISTSPVAEFSVNRTTGFTTDTFRFTDHTQNGATTWNWTFEPNNVAYLNGTSAGSQNPVVFLNSATAYNITLTSTNSMGSNSITKQSVVSALAFNSPGCSGCPSNSVPSTIDVGITRVTLADMDTTTALNTPIYHALYNVKKANLYRGVTYTLSTARTTNSDGMSTRAWIDFNRNTNFGDEPVEVIISENNQNKTVTTGTFKVPDNAPLGNTRMRVGVTLGSTNISQNVATLGCFEDYGIEIARDFVKPVLSLIGSRIERVEVNKPYVEKGVIGIDNLEGDISSRYQVYGSVDMSKVGYYTLKYTVADLYDNVSDTAYRTVQVEINQTGPKVTLIGDDTIRVDVYSSYQEQGATAQSNTGQDMTALIAKGGQADTSKLGTYMITYSVTDQFDFTSTAVRLVVVQDTIKPTIISEAGTPTFTHQVGTSYHDPIVVKDNYWKNITAVRSGLIIPDEPGSYNLRYDAQDGSGNIAETYYVTVVVKDLIPPTVKLEGENPLTVDVFTTFVDPGITASDNYYQNLTTVRTGVPTMNALGTFNVTYTVTDGAKNSTVVVRTVNVVDRIAPIIEMLGKNPMRVPRFSTSIEDPGVKLNDNFYSDAALRSLLVVDATEVDLNKPGYYFIKYDITDPSGNKAQTANRFVQVIASTTGTEELKENTNLSIYPNPSNGKMTITTFSGTDIKQVKVMDVLGNIVSLTDERNASVTLDITNGATGIYMVWVEDVNGNIYTSKLVKE